MKDTLNLHNILHIKSLPGDTQHDRDKILLHAIFQVLTDYVEKEYPFERINWESDPEHSFAGREIKYLYEWWKLNKDFDSFAVFDNEFKELEAKHGQAITIGLDGVVNFNSAYHDLYDRMWKIEANYEKELEQNMIRLVKIYRYLWT